MKTLIVSIVLFGTLTLNPTIATAASLGNINLGIEAIGNDLDKIQAELKNTASAVAASNVSSKMSDVSSKLAALFARPDLKDETIATKQAVLALKDRFDSIERKLVDVENKLGSKIDGLEKHIDTEFGKAGSDMDLKFAGLDIAVGGVPEATLQIIKKDPEFQRLLRQGNSFVEALKVLVTVDAKANPPMAEAAAKVLEIMALNPRFNDPAFVNALCGEHGGGWVATDAGTLKCGSGVTRPPVLPVATTNTEAWWVAPVWIGVGMVAGGVTGWAIGPDFDPTFQDSTGIHRPGERKGAVVGAITGGVLAAVMKKVLE